MTKKKQSKPNPLSAMAEMVLRRFDKKPLEFGLMFCEKHFPDESPEFHINLLKKCLGSNRVAIAAPRGFSKSTIVSFLYCLYCIVFRKKQHIVILQNTMGKAIGTLNSVKHEIKHNSMLQMFGIEFERDAQDETIFRHSDGHQIRVLCKGHEQMGSVRGEKFVAQRS